MTQGASDHGKIVVAAGTGINLALGVLYAWSIFKDVTKSEQASNFNCTGRKT